MTRCVKCGEEMEAHSHYRPREIEVGGRKLRLAPLEYPGTYTCTNKECPYYSLLQANLEE